MSLQRTLATRPKIVRLISIEHMVCAYFAQPALIVASQLVHVLCCASRAKSHLAHLCRGDDSRLAKAAPVAEESTLPPGVAMGAASVVVVWLPDVNLCRQGRLKTDLGQMVAATIATSRVR